MWTLKLARKSPRRRKRGRRGRRRRRRRRRRRGKTNSRRSIHLRNIAFRLPEFNFDSATDCCLRPNLAGKERSERKMGSKEVGQMCWASCRLKCSEKHWTNLKLCSPIIFLVFGFDFYRIDWGKVAAANVIVCWLSFLFSSSSRCFHSAVEQIFSLLVREKEREK